jgi:hypothetical protein
MVLFRYRWLLDILPRLSDVRFEVGEEQRIAATNKASLRYTYVRLANSFASHILGSLVRGLSDANMTASHYIDRDRPDLLPGTHSEAGARQVFQIVCGLISVMTAHAFDVIANKALLTARCLAWRAMLEGLWRRIFLRALLTVAI